MIRHYLAAVKSSGRKVSTVEMYHRCLRAFFIWADKTLQSGRPDIDIPKPKRPDVEVVPFTREEIERIFAVARTSRQKAILCILLDTGLRASELCRLLISQVDLIGGTLEIEYYDTGGKSRKRQLYIENTTRLAIWKYLATRKHKSSEDVLIASETERRLDRAELHHIINRLGKKARVNGTYPHRFRHTFAIEYLRNGGDVFTLQRLLGHASMKMVRHYLAIANADAQNTHRKASPVENMRLKL